MKRIILTLMATVMITGVAFAQVPLKIDFNQEGVDEMQDGFQSYTARHEVAEDFVTKEYVALGGTISLTPAWPNANGNKAMQILHRGGNAANWDNAAGDVDLANTWIGIDTRTGNHGNGNWDGTTGTPTYMTLALGGLPAGDYDWTSYHHDTESVHGFFRVELSLNSGANYTQLADGIMSNSRPTGGNPDSGSVESLAAGYLGPIAGPDITTLESTYSTSFTADGVNDVVFRFAPYANTAVHRQIWGMNGFELAPSVVPEPSSVMLGLMGVFAAIGLWWRRR